MINYGDLLSEDDQNLLLTWRDNFTDVQFGVGDMCNKYIRRKDELGVTKAFIYGAVGSYYGKQSRTIRDYSRVSEFYPKEVREQYQVLSFDHMRVAMRSENWKEVLEWAVNQDYRPATVDAMISQFDIKATTDQDSLEAALQPLRKFIVRLPHSIRSIVEAMLEDLEDYLKKAEALG